MSGTVKTVLIVAGVGLGVYVLIKLLAPSPATLVAPKSNTSAVSVGGFVGGALGGLIGALSSSSSSSSDNTISAPLSTSGAATASDLSKEGFNTGSYSSSDGFAFTDANGNFVAG